MAASKNPHLRLLHIRQEIDALQDALRGVTFGAYCESYTHRRVVERALQIISEAAAALPNDFRSRHSEAPWTAIVGIGNRLRHEYAYLSEERLWETVVEHIPKLRPIILAMIADLEGGDE